jgi:hypothetical protein
MQGILMEFLAASSDTPSGGRTREKRSHGLGRRLPLPASESLGNPAEKEAGDSRIVFAENIQKTEKVGLDARGQAGPFRDRRPAGDVEYMEPVLPITEKTDKVWRSGVIRRGASAMVAFGRGGTSS